MGLTAFLLSYVVSLQNRKQSQMWENKLMVPQGERWGGIGWKIGINIDNTAVYKLDNW